MKEPAKTPVIRIPASALREFEQMEKADWSAGIALEELLVWINGVAARFRPEEIGADSRASEELGVRTFRHYQTLGCIDAPERDGRRAVYGFRQYVQALLLRKLIWERVPSERIAELMAGRSTEELKRLLFEGIEITARAGGESRRSVAQGGGGVVGGEVWKRVAVVPGMELHLRADFSRRSDLRELLLRIEAVLRQNL